MKFGKFELDPIHYQLRRDGQVLKLERIPMELLVLLVERNGQIVSRDEIVARLWGKDVYLDTEHGINTAVRKIRRVLEDDSEQPKFVQTVTGKGYRFAAQSVSTTGSEYAPPKVAGAEARNDPTNSNRNRPSSIASGESLSFPVNAGSQDSFLVAVPPTRPWFKPTFMRSALVLLVAVVSVLAMYKAWSWLTKTPPPETVNTVPFTSDPGSETGPTFSPDGQQIAFTGNETHLWGRGYLYVKQIGSEHLLRLTNYPGQVVSSWSPDGRYLAFIRHTYSEENAGLYLISPLGGPERKLAEPPDFRPPSWSADGKWLAYTRGNSPNQSKVHVVNVDTGEHRVLPDPSPDCPDTAYPTYSYDGKYLAVVCSAQGVFRIYVQLPEGGEAHEIAVVRNWIEGLSWTADSRSLIYSDTRFLWRVSIDGEKTEKLLFAEDAVTPVVARSASRLAYVQSKFPADIWRLDLAKPSTPARPATKLISSTRGQLSPRISPDGKRVAFESLRSGNSEIWVCDLDGSNPVQLSVFGGPGTWAPGWSPDSHRIAFDSRVSGHAELYIVNADGGPVQRLITGTADASVPVWSADGQWIYFLTVNTPGVWKVSANGGNAVPLTKKRAYWLQVSPDGTRVFFSTTTQIVELWSVSAAGGNERREEGSPFQEASWTLANGGIYFIALSGEQLTDAHYSLNFLELASHRVKKIADPGQTLPAWLGGMTVSPDGHTLLFSKIDRPQVDIMLVEGFH